ncbi:VPA1262 family N-terminal domain-containing protein [Collimonas sp.]|jgi:hypothetical protein|uniref:VPA1262 family N-terminal domain-containing protein n=1 Tax=Collimonas sp. TaxID=1963772 RepID=UPI002D191DFF|nr:VPA1262 family N-terminal domain-containing protein [Collimonas sp.]HWX01418.1 VPA1262 family N-terminal domain-containing protein [Collimonas sp.]
MAWGMKEQIDHLEKLLVPGVVGMYRSFEVTEIVGYQAGTPARNFLSLLVAEPGEPSATSQTAPSFINSAPIKLRGTAWQFGVVRYRVAPEQVLEALRRFGTSGTWKPGAATLEVGNLIAVPPQFVPADSYRPHPWNGVLKNNYWDGSHVLEMFDITKNDVRFLLDKPKLLAELAALIRPCVPIGIDGLSDRLGNVLIQLPVTVVVTKVGGQQESDFPLEPTWHPNAEPRPLRISWEMYEDGTMEDFASTAVDGGPAKFPFYSQRMGARYVVWDDCNKVILGASAQTAFFGGRGMVSVTISGMNSETRDFKVPGVDGKLEPISKILHESNPRGVVTDMPTGNPREPWRSRRVFRESLHALQQRKEFVQYGRPSNAGPVEAFADIRWLLEQHGMNGAWIWDPFLNAKDVLNTLFFCPHPGADLRALSSGKKVSSCRKGVATEGKVGRPWKVEQQELMEEAQGNCAGLNLEFRSRGGRAGWSFHDRFLIFPGAAGGASAWSLGASVNSLGKKHHILQKVSDGELIRQSFLELWNTLAAPDYLVWKKP